MPGIDPQSSLNPAKHPKGHPGRVPAHAGGWQFWVGGLSAVIGALVAFFCQESAAYRNGGVALAALGGALMLWGGRDSQSAHA